MHSGAGRRGLPQADAGVPPSPCRIPLPRTKHLGQWVRRASGARGTVWVEDAAQLWALARPKWVDPQPKVPGNAFEVEAPDKVRELVGWQGAGGARGSGKRVGAVEWEHRAARQRSPQPVAHLKWLHARRRPAQTATAASTSARGAAPRACRRCLPTTPRTARATGWGGRRRRASRATPPCRPAAWVRPQRRGSGPAGLHPGRLWGPQPCRGRTRRRVAEPGCSSGGGGRGGAQLPCGGGGTKCGDAGMTAAATSPSCCDESGATRRSACIQPWAVGTHGRASLSSGGAASLAAWRVVGVMAGCN